jgi:hypothetical protein
MASLMNRLRPWLILLALCSAPGCSTHPEDLPPPSTEVWQEGLMQLDRMVSGEWSGRDFPKVRWFYVDELLERAESTRPLTSFPTNPLSSQTQPTCSEGVMALWMIESLRLDPPLGFASLNPLLLGGPDQRGSWQEISDRNTPAAIAAYRAWWSRVSELPPQERRADDPLAGTGIAWFGSAGPR